MRRVSSYPRQCVSAHTEREEEKQAERLAERESHGGKAKRERETARVTDANENEIAPSS